MAEPRTSPKSSSHPVNLGNAHARRRGADLCQLAAHCASRLVGDSPPETLTVSAGGRAGCMAALLGGVAGAHGRGPGGSPGRCISETQQ